MCGSSDYKTGLLMATSIANLRQAQIELTMNVKMMMLNVLTRMPRFTRSSAEHYVTEQSENGATTAESEPKDYETHFKPIMQKVTKQYDWESSHMCFSWFFFTMSKAEYECIFSVAAKIAKVVDATMKERQEQAKQEQSKRQQEQMEALESGRETNRSEMTNKTPLDPNIYLEYATTSL